MRVDRLPTKQDAQDRCWNSRVGQKGGLPFIVLTEGDFSVEILLTIYGNVRLARIFCEEVSAERPKGLRIQVSKPYIEEFRRCQIVVFNRSCLNE